MRSRRCWTRSGAATPRPPSSRAPAMRPRAATRSCSRSSCARWSPTTSGSPPPRPSVSAPSRPRPWRTPSPRRSRGSDRSRRRWRARRRCSATARRSTWPPRSPACRSPTRRRPRRSSSARGLVQDSRELRFRHPILAGAVSSTLRPASGPPPMRRPRRSCAPEARDRSASRCSCCTPRRAVTPPWSASCVSPRRTRATAAPSPTAAVLLDRALAEPPDVQARGAVLLELGRAEQATGRSTVAFAHLEEAHRCAADPRIRARAIMLLGASSGGPAQRRRIADLAEAVLPEAEALDADLALRLRGILALEERSGALPELTGATAAEASLLGHLVFARMVPGARAAEVGDLARRAANQVDALLAEGGSPLPFVGMVLGLRWSHQLDEAERLTTRAIAAARRRGSPTDFATSMSLRALVRRRGGRLPDAEADARSALAAALDPDWLFASGIVPLVLTLVDQGRADEAMSEFGAVLTQPDPRGTADARVGARAHDGSRGAARVRRRARRLGRGAAPRPAAGPDRGVDRGPRRDRGRPFRDGRW